jgi:hypothetical protein
MARLRFVAAAVAAFVADRDGDRRQKLALEGRRSRRSGAVDAGVRWLVALGPSSLVGGG